MGAFADVEKKLATAKANNAAENHRKQVQTEDNAVAITSTNMGLYVVEFDAQRHAMEHCTTDMAHIINTVEQQHKTWDFQNKKREDQAKRRVAKLLQSIQAKTQHVAV